MKNENTPEVALIDLDGTLADYDASFRNWMDLIRSPDEPPFEDRSSLKKRGAEEPDHLYERRQLIQRLPGFWRTLAPIPLGFEVLQIIKEVGFEPHILTKGPAKSPIAYMEKVEWCAEHVPDALVTISADKSMVYGRVLFDDYPPYFTAWRKQRPRGLVICLAHPWNIDFADGGSAFDPLIFRYDGSNKSGLRRVLQEALDRENGKPYQD